MSFSETKAEIIERFVEHCQRSTQMPLGFLEVDDDVCVCSSEPAEIVSVLTGEFSLEDLVDSGILVAGEREAVALAPALTDGASFIVLRDAVTQRPYELLTHAGCLAADTLPVFEILRDGHTQRLIEQGTGDLIIAFDLEHITMLRASGLPATLAVGLNDLPLEQVGRFCESFNLSCFESECTISHEEIEAEHGLNTMNDGDVGAAHASTAASAEPVRDSGQPLKAHLVILGWTPLELSSVVPLQLKAVVDHLHRLQRFMGVELYDIGLWEVDEETIERLRFIATRGSAAIFKVALLDAAEDIGASIVQFGKEKPLAIGPPSDYTTALARLHEALSAECGTRLLGPNQRNEAWRDVQSLLSQQVIRPVRELALESNNPVERNLLMGFAELSNVFHMQSVVMGEQLSRRIADGGVERNGQLPEGQFKNLMAMADRLIGMARAIEKCSQPRTTIIESRRIDSQSFPRLPHSG